MEGSHGLRHIRLPNIYFDGRYSVKLCGGELLCSLSDTHTPNLNDHWYLVHHVAAAHCSWHDSWSQLERTKYGTLPCEPYSRLLTSEEVVPAAARSHSTRRTVTIWLNLHRNVLRFHILLEL